MWKDSKLAQSLTFITYLLILIGALHVAGALHKSKLAWAEPLADYCEKRGFLAMEIARSIDSGLSLDNINLAWLTAPKTYQEKIDRQFWVFTLKQEVDELISKGVLTSRIKDRVQQACVDNSGATRMSPNGTSI